MRLVNAIIEHQYRLGFERLGKVFIFEEGWAISKGVPTNLMDAIVNGNEFTNVIEPIINSYLETGETDTCVTVYPMDNINYGPTVPQGKKIICVGLNYKKHAEESNMELPKVPLLFSKYDNTLAGHNAMVYKPSDSSQMDYEAEVGVVIGKIARNVTEEDALDYVYGYTNANDLSARDLQFVTSQWLVGKTCDGFCPTGPFLVTADEISNPNQLDIRCIVNGKVRQNASTALMIFPFTQLISYISHCFTLNPGDIILSGTPDGVIYRSSDHDRVWLQPGDEVIVETQYLGNLRTVIG